MCSEVHHRLAQTITWRGATRTRSTKMALQLFKFLIKQRRNWFLLDCDIERPVDRGFEVCDWFHGYCSAHMPKLPAGTSTKWAFGSPAI